MSVVRMPEANAGDWAYASLAMKECLEEFFRTSRRPKGMNPMLCGAFESLLVPAIFFSSPDANPTRKDAPKEVRADPISNGIGKLVIATKVLKSVGIAYETNEQAATHLRKYRRTLRKLAGMSQLKKRDVPELEALRDFIVALSRRAVRAGDARRLGQVFGPDDDDD